MEGACGQPYASYTVSWATLSLLLSNSYPVLVGRLPSYIKIQFTKEPIPTHTFYVYVIARCAPMAQCQYFFAI